MLIAHDGFDHYNSSADLGQRSGKLQWTPRDGSGSGAVVSIVAGLGGAGKAVKLQAGASFDGTAILTGSLDVSRATQIIGYRCFIPNPDGTNLLADKYLDFIDTATGDAQLRIIFLPASGSLSVYRGPSGASNGTLLGSSDNNLFAHNVATFFEIELTVDDTAGAVTIRNNSQEIYSLSGVDTKATANASWGAVVFRPVQHTILGHAYFIVDDFYAVSTNSSDSGLYPNNSFLGDVRTVTLFATGNDSVAWTPLAGANWQEVSETAMDSDTSYNSSSTPTDKDSFVFGPLTGTISQVIAVSITGAYRKDEAGARTLKQAIDSGGSGANGATVSLPEDNYAYFTDTFPQDPDGPTAWTVAAVNALKGSYELIS